MSYELRCRNCRRVFESVQRYARVCPYCRKTRKYTKALAYAVVASPVDERTGLADFPVGARFSMDEVEETLKNKYFPDGLMLRHHGSVYKVVGDRLQDYHGQLKKA